MSKSERRWLRKSVILGIATATVTIVVMVLVAGATSTAPFIGSSLTGMANQTLWNAAAAFTGLDITILLIPLICIGIIAIILGLLMCGYCAGQAGY